MPRTPSAGTRVVRRSAWGRFASPPFAVLAVLAATVSGSLVVAVSSAPASPAARSRATRATGVTPPAGLPGRWNLVFDDEFNGPSLDRSIWRTCYDWGCTISTNNEEESYVSSGVSLGGGRLVLTATQRSTRGLPFSSGMVQSNGRFDFEYGYMEIRAKVPTSPGVWPAFWAVPENGSWPPEIDAMEFYANQPNAVQETVHFPPGDTQLNHIVYGPDFGNGYHIYGADWEPGSVSFYVDGVLRFRVAQSPALPMYLIANLAVSSPPSAATAHSYPASYEIDWIRVYQHPGIGSSSCPRRNCVPVPS